MGADVVGEMFQESAHVAGGGAGVGFYETNVNLCTKTQKGEEDVLWQHPQ